MQIEDLPYPVYCVGSPDYLGVLFTVDIEQVESKDPLHFTVRGRFDIQNEDIMDLIAAEQAGFGLLIECDSTDYRELRPCAVNFQENLIKAYFNEVVTVTPVIYARSEIEHYHNSDLIEEIKSLDITLPEGAIIATDGDLDLFITRSQPQTVESICKFKSNEFPGYDIEGDSIILYVPPDVFRRYSKMTKNQKIQVTSVYFPPVLESIIDNIFSARNSDYKDRLWYESIHNSLESRGIDPAEYEPYLVMMNIIGDFLTEGVSYIPISESDGE